MAWTVKISRKADKQKEKLPERVKSSLLFLMHEISRSGPIRGDWPNYEITYVGTHEKAPY